MAGSYDYRFVALSVVIAIAASYTALDLAGGVTAARGRMRLLWLTGGATAQGIGTWSMHYIGMLAFSLPVPIDYDWPTVLVSLLTAILSSALALFVVSRQTMGAVRVGAASIFMGGDLHPALHLHGGSMRLQGVCHYSHYLPRFQVVLAIAFSLISLQLTFFFRNQAPCRSGREIATQQIESTQTCSMTIWST
jgi:NO-binding membrane sensor protein with MHYT domain